MVRSLAIVSLALILSAPASAQGLQSATGQDLAALRLMNDTQFKEFLKRLDADIMSWKGRLKALDVPSLRVGPEDTKEIRRSYTVCMLTLESARGDIQQLTRKQTLKLDFLLLVDLNALARSLDRLSGNLASPVTVQKASYAQKSLSWAREVLNIDVALAGHVTEIQHHVLALAGLLDAALERTDQNPSPARK